MPQTALIDLVLTIAKFMNSSKKPFKTPRQAVLLRSVSWSLVVCMLFWLLGPTARAQNNDATAATTTTATTTTAILPTPVSAALTIVKELEAVTVQNFDWQDDSRNRAVPVRLYLPAAPVLEAGSAAKPVPLIVFSHGLGGSRNGYQYLGRYWASQGFASLHVQHVGSDNAVWRGNPFALTYRLSEAAKDTEAIARARDVSFAITELLAMPAFANRLDANRIVAAGHSYGANTTMLLAGAAVPNRGGNGKGDTINLRDPRIKAAMLLSAPPFYGFSNMAAILGGITLPTLHITSTADDIMVPGYGSGVDDRVNVFNAIGDARKTLVIFTGGSHNIFTDRTNTGGAELNPKIKAATQALSLAFLQQIFGGETTALTDWQPKFADLLAKFVPGK
jgi:predicted dienelactone hydrolase